MFVDTRNGGYEHRKVPTVFMKWTIVPTNHPSTDTRRIRCGFLFLPMTMYPADNTDKWERRWLEAAYWVEWCSATGGWYQWRWATPFEYRLWADHGLILNNLDVLTVVAALYCGRFGDVGAGSARPEVDLTEFQDFVIDLEDLYDIELDDEDMMRCETIIGLANITSGVIQSPRTAKKQA